MARLCECEVQPPPQGLEALDPPDPHVHMPWPLMLVERPCCPSKERLSVTSRVSRPECVGEEVLLSALVWEPSGITPARLPLSGPRQEHGAGQGQGQEQCRGGGRRGTLSIDLQSPV